MRPGASLDSLNGFRPFVNQSLEDYARFIGRPLVGWLVVATPFFLLSTLGVPWVAIGGALLATGAAGIASAQEFCHGRGGPVLSMLYPSGLGAGLGYVCDSFLSAEVLGPVTFEYSRSMFREPTSVGVGTLAILVVGFLVTASALGQWQRSLDNTEFDAWCDEHIHESYVDQFKALHPER